MGPVPEPMSKGMFMPARARQEPSHEMQHAGAAETGRQHALHAWLCDGNGWSTASRCSRVHAHGTCSWLPHVAAATSHTRCAVRTRQRGKDVGEQHHAIGLERVPRLQRDLNLQQWDGESTTSRACRRARRERACVRMHVALQDSAACAPRHAPTGPRSLSAHGSWGAS